MKYTIRLLNNNHFVKNNIKYLYKDITLYLPYIHTIKK